MSEIVWRRRKRAFETGRNRSNKTAYMYRYEIGSDCYADGTKVGWTAVCGRSWWWRTKATWGGYFKNEKAARNNFEHTHGATAIAADRGAE